MIFSLALTACDPETMRLLTEQVQPEPAYRAPSSSTEVVNMNVKNQMHLLRLAAMIAGEPPSRVDLNCDVTEPLCAQAKILLEKNNIPVTVHDRTDVTLVYTRAAVGSAPASANAIDNSNVQTAPATSALPAPSMLWNQKQ